MSNITAIKQFSYPQLLAQVKQRVRLAQQRAAYSAYGEMLRMYWDVGICFRTHKKKLAGAMALSNACP